MLEKNPFGPPHKIEGLKGWMEKHSIFPLTLLEEKTGDKIPNDTKITPLSGFDSENMGILDLSLKGNNEYSAQLSISRYPDEKMKLEYTRNGKTNILGEVNGEEHIKNIGEAFIEFKKSNNPDRVDQFLSKILDNTEFENQGNGE